MSYNGMNAGTYQMHAHVHAIIKYWAKKMRVDEMPKGPESFYTRCMLYVFHEFWAIQHMLVFGA